jgi:hypothetical protein
MRGHIYILGKKEYRREAGQTDKTELEREYYSEDSS